MKDNTKNNEVVSNRNAQNQVPQEIGTVSSIFEKHSRVLGKSIQNFKDLYGLKIPLPTGGELTSVPHFVKENEGDIVCVSYDNSLGVDQKDIVKLLGDRRVAISINHHAIKPKESLKEQSKLQCTHAQLLTRSGNAIVTLNNPQSYESGLFGNETYPMILFLPTFPEGTSKEVISEYEKNIILWGTIINTVSTFPRDYNGGDPLSAKNLKEVIEIGDVALEAITGDQSAASWFKREDKHLYCAEFVYLALTLGINYPINERTLGVDLYSQLKERVKSRDFIEHNENPLIDKVLIELPSEDLLPVFTDTATDGLFGEGLAVRPMLSSDLLTSFIKFSVDRKKLGEEVAPIQLALFKKALPQIKQMLPPSCFDEGSKLSVQLKKLENVLGANFGNYESFKNKLRPILKDIDEEVMKYSVSLNTFIPPHAFFVRALEFEREGKTKGVLGMEYLAHGVHSSLM